MRGSGARLLTTAIVADSRFPFPQSLQKSGNSHREVHRLSRFRNHQTACSCLPLHFAPTLCSYTLLQIFSVTLFEKVPMSQAFFKTRTTSEPDEVANQLNLFAY